MWEKIVVDRLGEVSSVTGKMLSSTAGNWTQELVCLLVCQHEKEKVSTVTSCSVNTIGDGATNKSAVQD